MIRIVSQRTAMRTYAYADRPIPEHDWKSQTNAIDTTVRELSPVLAEQLAKDFLFVVRNEGAYGISDAFWRLVAIRGDTTVQTTGGRIELPGGVGKQVDLTGPYTRATIPDALSLAVAKLAPPDPPQPVAEPKRPRLPPVPAGTVVEILDEWGLPINSTEVI